MKHLIKLALLLPATATATDLMVNGIYYNIRNDNEVEVTYKDNNYSSYTGEVFIPSQVTYNSVNYSVTAIGDLAFYNCTDLTSVSISNTIATIGHEAFYNCNKLTNITIPNSVTSIGWMAFSDCSSLTNIDIPNSVTTIVGGTFQGCTSLTSVNISSSITSIQDQMFYGCSGLSSITIPNTVTYIGSYAFYDCNLLKSITIPRPVTYIGEQAFYGCTAMDTLYFNAISCHDFSPGQSPFYDLNIKTIIIEDDVQRIPDYFACSLTKLTSINIPDSITTIGKYSFAGCGGLSDSMIISNSVTSIGEGAFIGCTGFTSINISNFVTTIGNYAFEECSGLDVVYSYISDPSQITMGDDVFNCYSANYDSRILYVPAGTSAAYQADTRWSDYFGSIVEMEGDTISFADANVKAICVQNWDKNGDEELSKFEAAAVADLGRVFQSKYITSFNELQFFTGLESIGSSAFSGCGGLRAITIPNSVTAIADSAFYGTAIDSIAIPQTVVSIGNAAFKNCHNLSRVTCYPVVPPVMENSFDEHRWLCSYWDSYFSEGELPALTLLVPEEAYGNYKALKEENQFFNFIAYIGASKTQPPTFSVECEEDFLGHCTSCSVSVCGHDDDDIIISWSWSENWNSSMDNPSETSFYSFTAPEGSVKPKYFDVYAIAIKEGCLPSDVAMTQTPGLLPASEIYTGIGGFDFESGGVYYSYVYGTDNLQVVTPYYYECYYEWGYLNYITQEPYPYSGDLYVSSEVDGHLVTTIGELMGEVASIYIPSSVTTIGDYAFWGCNGLTNIEIPNSVTTIGSSAFFGCGDLTSIEIPNSVMTIGDYAFEGCSGLTNITIPNSVTTIGSGAFSGCSSLTSITVANENTVYDSRNNCNAIIETSTNTLIKGCQNTIIPTSVTSIGSSAFWGCSGLTSITIPNNVTTIGDGAFSYCNGLNEVYSYISDPASITMGSNVFKRNPENYDNRILYVPIGTLAAYQADTRWSDYFGSIVEMGNYFTIPDTTVMHGDTIVVPVKMFNEASVISFQTDIFLPEGLELLQEDGEYIIDPSERMTRTHSIMSDNVSNGSIRVLCYSSNYKPFTGNSGDDLFYLTLKVADDAEGDYTIQLKNTLLTNTDFVDMPAPDVAATVNVKAYILGDANNSRLVTVGDVVATAQYVLEQNPQPFIFEAADVNFDGNITVADVSRIAWMVLNPDATAPRRAPALQNSGDHMSGEGISLMPGETRRVSIALDNALDYSAFQLDMSLPEGLTASNFQLTDRAGSHAFDVNTLGNSNIRALCYSPALTAISGHEGALLSFDVTATSTVTDAIMVDGIELVTTACESVRLDGFAIDVNSTSGVNEQVAGKTVARVDYYNLAGQQIDRPETGVTLVVTTYTDGTRATAKIVR